MIDVRLQRVVNLALYKSRHCEELLLRSNPEDQRKTELLRSARNDDHALTTRQNFLVAILSSLFLILPASLAAEKNPLPRFVSLKSNEINQRVGPGPNYPIEWTYVKAGLPVEIIAEFDNWRKIRDKDGIEGWVHQSMVCGKRHGLVQGQETIIYARSDLNSQPIASLDQGVMVEILKCRDDWCQVRISNYKGWIQRVFLWGIYPQEVIG